MLDLLFPLPISLFAFEVQMGDSQEMILCCALLLLRSFETLNYGTKAAIWVVFRGLTIRLPFLSVFWTLDLCLTDIFMISFGICFVIFSPVLHLSKLR